MTEPREVGIRQLKEQASEIVRQVRETHASYDVTYRGKVVARIVPAETETKPSPEEVAKWLAEGDAIAAEISAKWPKGVTVAQVMEEDRR